MTFSSKNIVKSGDASGFQELFPKVRKWEPERVSREEFTFVESVQELQEKQKTACEEPVMEEVIPEEPEIVEEEPEEIPEVLQEALAKADEVIKEAMQIRKEAKEQALLDKQKAAEAGYQEGFEWGVQEGQRQSLIKNEQKLQMELDSLREEMNQALAAVEKAKEQIVEKYLDELKDCAIAVGEKVVHISLESSGNVIKRMILAETEKLKKTSWVRIYMGKADYELMMEADADIANELSRLSDNVKFVVMNKEKRGDCIVEMPDEVIDISVDTQFENIRKVLENVR